MKGVYKVTDKKKMTYEKYREDESKEETKGTKVWEIQLLYLSVYSSGIVAFHDPNFGRCLKTSKFG